MDWNINSLAKTARDWIFDSFLVIFLIFIAIPWQLHPRYSGLDIQIYNIIIENDIGDGARLGWTHFNNSSLEIESMSNDSRSNICLLKLGILFAKISYRIFESKSIFFQKRNSHYITFPFLYHLYLTERHRTKCQIWYIICTYKSSIIQITAYIKYTHICMYAIDYAAYNRFEITSHIETPLTSF